MESREDQKAPSGTFIGRFESAARAESIVENLRRAGVNAVTRALAGRDPGPLEPMIEVWVAN